MLALLCLALAFCAAVVSVAAFAARWGARRLSLDLMDVLFWLGLAVRPVLRIPRPSRAVL